MAKIEYIIGKEKYRIEESEIKKLLPLTENNSINEAVQIWLEDNDYIENEEQNALDDKAKKNKVKLGAKDVTKKTQRERVVKEDKDKEKIIKELAEKLQEFGTDVTIVNKGKLIEFTMNGDKYKVDLVRQRKPKEK